MDPNQLRVINWYAYNETYLNPVALIITLLMGILILCLERKYIIVPIMVVVCYIPYIQRIVIGGFDFDMVRLLILFGLLRLLLRNEKMNLVSTPIDKMYYVFTIIGSIAYILLRKTGGAVVNRLGFMFNAFGLYLLIRYAIRGIDDCLILIKSLIVLSIPITMAMIIEQITGRNYFSVFGDVPEFTMLREGRLRSQGAFPHAILAGTFGGALLPLTWAYYHYNPRHRFLALLGTVCGLIIVVTSSSSGPIMTLGGSLCGIIVWTFRKEMSTIRRGIVAMLIVIQLGMQGPIYTLVWRLTVVGGSTGYHRYLLIDNAVRRFREWFLFGIESTAHWAFGLQDITNQYILVGVNGGIIALVLFIIILVRCFKAVGIVRLQYERDEAAQRVVWALGAVLFAHCVSFLGVSYFGNMIFFLYLIIAMISSLQGNMTADKVQTETGSYKSIAAGLNY